MKYLQSYYTDIGTTRGTNQDSLAILKAETALGEVLLAILCDGMGGHSMGELASKTCVTLFADWFKQELPGILYGEGSYETQIPGQWQQLVQTANRRLADYGAQTGLQLGSTLTAALFLREELFLIHVGDTRCYEIGDRVTRLTRDHSLAAAMERGELPATDPAPKRNVLTQCVGITPRVQADQLHKTISGEESFLLCSDGFWHYALDRELIRDYAKPAVDSNKTLRKHLNQMVEELKSRGETDNISVIAVIPHRDSQER